MKSTPSRTATACVAVATMAALAGCAGIPSGGRISPDVSRPAGLAQKASWMLPEALSDNLLYISDPGYGAVFVYAYKPNAMKFVGMLTGTDAPGPMCVDLEQNVWILSQPQIGSFAAVEYAHGGTQPIAMLIDPAGWPTGCAVDPVNGNLAISSGLEGQPPTIAIFDNARGKPKLFVDSAIPGFYTCCAYDGKGNLFGYGTEDSQDGRVLAELPRGSSTFVSVPLHRYFDQVAGLQWDGTYLTVGDDSPGTIVQFKVVEGVAKEMGSTALSRVTRLGQYFVSRKRVIAPDAPREQSGLVGIFAYPAGGQRIRIRPFSAPVAVVLSRASNK